MFELHLNFFFSLSLSFLGQWAATRPDLFPEEFTTKLVKLQDSTRTHPWEIAETTLNNSFGPSWPEFLDIDKQPIGSGCIAQVVGQTDSK